MTKVCDLLMLPALREIQVAAGENGLERKVEHVTVMEVPDIKRWLKGNDFLITSFYSVRKSEKEQCDLIRDLSDTCCCIAVKTGQYVDRLSENVKKAADECGIPLLEIPFAMPYIDIIIHVMNQIFEEEGSTAILEKYVKDILYENYNDEILMEERGRLFGFEVKKNYYMAINVSFRKKYVPSKTEKKALRSLAQCLQQYVKESGNIWGCYLITLEKGYLILAEADEPAKLGLLPERIALEGYVRKLWKQGIEKLSCSTGSVEQGLQGIRDTYSYSFKAMHVGRRLYREQPFYSYERLKIFCNLEEFLTKGNGVMFTDILAPIKNMEILATLEMYYECDSNMDQVAERMFTHKNTVKYRLNRIQELTGLELKKTDDNFKLYLAVLARKMNG